MYVLIKLMKIDLLVMNGLTKYLEITCFITHSETISL